MRILIILSLTTLLACSGKKSPPAAAEATDEVVPLESTSANLVDKIQLVDLQNNSINLNDYRGKTVFLNFWATWCKPCILEMPSIQRAQQELADENFVFLLASDESIDKIKRFQSMQDFELTFVRITDSFAELGIYSIPTTLVIDPQGKITLNQVGAMEWDAPEVLNKLRTNTP
ncbi:MAG: TlpA family protein disulfide reductase [Cyclobacteriaceae bacterium]|nr:TlpA family protein disulfide reductase [Cyclobacteriaceae bacterium]